MKLFLTALFFPLIVNAVAHFDTLTVEDALKLTYLTPGQSLYMSGTTVASQVLSTTIVPEGSFLYFTPARAQAAFTFQSPLSATNGTVSITLPTLTANSPLVYSGGTLSIPAANGSTNGYLSSGDWTTFNSKQAAISATSPVLFAANTVSLGTVGVANGGTGETTASGAINALLPSQSGQSGNFLTTNGTLASWGAAPAAFTSGTLTTMNATTGTDGQLFYNTTYHHMFEWISNRWQPVGQNDPRFGFLLQEEFVQASVTNIYGSINGGFSIGTAVDGRQGVAVLTAGSGASTRGGVQLSNNATFNLIPELDMWAEGGVRMDALSTGSEEYVYTFGFHDNGAFNANGDATDGAYFRYHRATNGNFWAGVTFRNGTSSVGTSAIAVTTGWTNLLIKTNGTTSVDFYVNGTLAVSNSGASIPQGTGRQMGFISKIDKTVGGGSATGYIDWFKIQGFYNTAR